MTFAARIAALCGLALLTVGMSPEPPLAAVLAEMRAASGLAYRYHVVSLSERDENGDRTLLRADNQGKRFFIRNCGGAICVGTYFDGRRLYSVDMNGTALPRSRRAERYLRGLMAVSSGAFLGPQFEARGGSIADGGSTVSGGRTYRKLFVAKTDAIPMEVYVDPRSWLVAAVRDVDGDTSIAFRDYRRVGALMLPFRIDQNGEPIEVYARRRISERPFRAPHGLVPTFAATPLPMPIAAAGRTPVGPCSLQGVRSRCLIDTGNSGLAMSLELAERLHAPVIGGFEVSGLGKYATEVVRAGPLQVGSVTFPRANYVVLDDIHRYGYDVVLGADILASTAVTIDYGARDVWFGAVATPAGAATIPMEFENFVPVVPVTLNDLTTRLAVDTGDQSTINLAYPYYMRHKTLFKATRARTVSGVGGTSVEFIGIIPNVRIGDYTVASSHIGATRILKGTAHGHLGGGFLSHFRVTIDYPRRRIILLARRGDAAIRRNAPR